MTRAELGAPVPSVRSRDAQRRRELVVDYLRGLDPDLDFDLVGGAIVERAALESSGYLVAFPELVGAVRVAEPGLDKQRRMLAEYAAGRDWGAALQDSGLALTASSCHHVFAKIAGSTVTSVRGFIIGPCFRYEREAQPGRYRQFDMAELVAVGGEEYVQQFVDVCTRSATKVFDGLGLRTRLEEAADSFTGMSTIAQPTASIRKLEAVARIEGRPLAVGSINHHAAHFADRFGFECDDGRPAHSACFAFGIDRMLDLGAAVQPGPPSDIFRAIDGR